jgi:hypothetical protein
MKTQLTDTILMIAPDSFGFNPETASTNTFQHTAAVDTHTIREKAQKEFDVMKRTLEEKGVRVIAMPSPAKLTTPDAVFPNNWISFHEGGRVVVYPMLAPNRRLERQLPAVRAALKDVVPLTTIEDLTAYESHGRFLEGTGSLVLDREHRVAFAVLSPRTHEVLVQEFCERMGYEPVLFHAVGDGVPVYHTNVVMGIGKGFAVVCVDAIVNDEERRMIEKKIASLGLDLIAITIAQMNAFCGNLLELVSTDGKPLIVLSQKAYDAFTKEQRLVLEKYGELVPVAIPTIETIGGGSARCMLAEVFV